MAPTERQARILWSSVTALAVGILLALTGLLIWGLGWVIERMSSVLIPLAVAGVIAYIFDPVVDYFERRLKSRIRAIWLVFLLAILLILGLASTVLPRLINEAQSFVGQVPTYVSKVRDRVDRFLHHPPQWMPSRFLLKFPTQQSGVSTTNAVSLPIAQTPPAPPAAAGEGTKPAAAEDAGTLNFNLDLTQQLFTWAARSLPKVGAWMLEKLSRFASVAGLLAGLALVPVYLFYFLLEKRGIENRWREFIPVRESQTKEEVVFVLGSINDCLIVFFRGQVLVALCVGTILAIGFSVLGLNYALLLGVMAGVLGIVPYLGVALSIIPAVTIAIVQFGDWFHPLAVLAIFGGAQALEGLVISPKIIGDRVGLHPLTIIIAVMTGTTLFGGILGGVLAIPLTAVLRTLMFRYVWAGKDRLPNTPALARPTRSPESG